MVAFPPISPETPAWFQRFAQQLQNFVGQTPSRPFKLWFVTTAKPPAAADWEGALVYDETTNQVKYSNGSAWNAL